MSGKPDKNVNPRIDREKCRFSFRIATPTLNTSEPLSGYEIEREDVRNFVKDSTLQLFVFIPNYIISILPDIAEGS